MSKNRLFTDAIKSQSGAVVFNTGVCAVDVRFKGGKRTNRVAYGVHTLPPGRDGDVVIMLVKADGSSDIFHVKSADKVKVAEDKSNIRFSAYGNTYKIRAIQDKDADWALGRSDKIKKPKTAEELKRVLMQNRTLWTQT